MRKARTDKVSDQQYHEPEYVDIDFSSIGVVDFKPDVDVDNDKAVSALVKKLKAETRSTYEYKELMTFLKYHRDRNNCIYYPKIGKSKSKKRSKVSLEMHHTPFTISDIILTVLRKRIANDERVLDSDITREVMTLHYRGIIGLVPVCKTAHQLIHSDNTDVFIPLGHIEEDVHQFVTEYKKHIPDSLLENWESVKKMSAVYEDLSDAVPDFMIPKHLYYNIAGIDFLNREVLEELMNSIEDEK
jgi:hypothetical protein